MNNNNFNEVYLSEIIEEAHVRPIFGWNESYFEKNIKKMILKQIKKQGAKEFNDFFISKDLLDFKDVFKETPEIESSGGGKKLLLKFIYTLKLNKGEAKQILIGIPEDDGTYSKKGLLFNEHFMEMFHISLAEDNKEEEEALESIEYVYTNTIINEGLLGDIKDKLLGKKKKNIAPPFDIKDVEKLIKEDDNKLTIILEFDSVQYIDKIKKKWMLNLNYVKGMKGKAYFQFNGADEIGPFQVTDDDGLEWLQKRTENMDPPKPIKDEIKQIWKNPNEGAGLLGLAAKKMIGGIGSTLFGPTGGSVIQDADLLINFKDDYSMKNMKGERTKAKTKAKLNNEPNLIEDMLDRATKYKIDWIIEYKEKNTFECSASCNGEDILKFTIILG